MDKRKSESKHPYQCRRSRTSTSNLLFPYLMGPEFFVSPSMSTVQTRPVYSTARSGSSLSSTSPFISGYSSFVDPMVSFDSNLVSSNSSLLHTESGVVKNLLIRLTTQSFFFYCKWIGAGLWGPVLLTSLLFSLIP